MAVYTLSLANVRDRVEYKLRSERDSAMVDNWINDVIQALTAEIWFDDLYKEGVNITGDGTKRIFDLPEDFAAMAWMFSTFTDNYLEEASPRELIEDWRSEIDTPVETPMSYAILGRTGTDGASSFVPTTQIKFDAKVPNLETVLFAYYRLHPLVTDAAPDILLPQALLKTIVDGVLVEADAWNDSDQFAMHRDRYTKAVDQLKKNQNRRPNRRRGMGRSPRMDRGRPGRVSFPSNYPDVWGD